MSRVSVLVVRRDDGEGLRGDIESALAQTFRDIEVVVVDDGSTDPPTVDLLRTYRPPRTRILTTARGSRSAALEVAIGEASGEFFLALEPGVRLEPTFVERAVEILDRDSSISFVAGGPGTGAASRIGDPPARCDLESLLDIGDDAAPAVSRRSAVEAVGGYDGRAAGLAEADLRIGLAERGGTGAILPETFVRRSAPPDRAVAVDPRPAVRYVVEKRHASYERHAEDLLGRLEDEDRTCLAESEALAERVEAAAPLVARLEAERARLEARLGAGSADAGGADLRAALDRARAEIAALRGSSSWRLTAPLRSVLDRIRGLDRRGGA